MKGYKAFESDWSCRGFKYEIGKTYSLRDDEHMEMCKCGFHFCANPIDVFGYYPLNNDTKIAEVEALGKIEQAGTKFVTDKIRIVKEYSRKQLQALILDGNRNSGNRNSGYYNSGNYNSGDYNSGNYNSGDYNSGNRNSGYYNSGNYNSGNRNSGDYNSGNYNSGDYNSGYYNSGYYNSGNYNSGNRNSGYYNSGNYNSGIFNNQEPKMMAFDKPADITLKDFFGSIDYSFFELCERISKKDLRGEDIKNIRELPNYDAGIFYEITGIDLRSWVKE